MKIGGKVVGKKKKGKKGNSSQHAQYTPGVFAPAGRKRGKSKSSSKAAKMYASAMKHQPA